jgi:hypothetical protein
MKKRAQLTIFVLLGLVILIIFAIVFFVSKESSDLVLEKRINRIYGDFLRQSSIETFIQACMEQATKTGITLAALQGGRIYDYQVPGGYTLNNPNQAVPANLTGFLVNVSYGIRAPSLLSTYPDNKPLVKDPEVAFLPEKYKRLFVKKENNDLNPYSLPAICNFYGPNWWDISNATRTCEPQDFNNDSMQQYLRLFIVNRTQQCVSFSQFEQGQFKISEGNVDALIAWGNEDLFVSLRYPLEVSIRGQPPATKFLSFAYRPKFRVKKTYELATHLIGFYGAQHLTKPPKTDGNNAFFNITGTDPNDCYDPINGFDQPCILPGMEVNKTFDYCKDNLQPFCDVITDHNKNTDILEIKDTQTIINGQPLIFRFAIENRAPALGFIPEQTPGLGNDLHLPIIARDPDEDTLTYLLFDGSNPYPADEHDFTPQANGDTLLTVIAPTSGDLKIRVEDPEQLFDEQTFTISIS